MARLAVVYGYPPQRTYRDGGSSRCPATAGVATLRSGLSIRARRAPPSSSLLSWARFRAKVGRPRGCCSPEPQGASGPPRAVMWRLVVAGERSEQEPVGRGRKGRQAGATHAAVYVSLRARSWASADVALAGVSVVGRGVRAREQGGQRHAAPRLLCASGPGVSGASHRWFTAAALRRRR